jgi:hypothetical protein
MFTRAHGSLTLPEASTLGGGLFPLRGFLLRSRTLLLYLERQTGAHSSTELGFLEAVESRQ